MGVGHDDDALGFGQARTADVRVDDIDGALVEEVAELEAVGVLLAGADGHVDSLGEAGVAVDVPRGQDVLPPADVAERVEPAPVEAGFVEGVSAEGVDQHLSSALEDLADGGDAGDVAGFSAAFGETHFPDGEAAFEELAGVFLQFGEVEPPTPW